MKCPRCGYEEFTPSALCPDCGFSGSLANIEELSHVQYLLDELADWKDVSSIVKERKRKQYTRRQRKLEIALELRPPPLTPQEARDAAKEMLRLRQLLQLLNQWNQRDWVKSEAADELTERSRKRIKELKDRQAEPDTPPAAAIERPADRVTLLKSLQDMLDQLREENAWVDEAAYRAAGADLAQRVRKLEIKLGLHKPEKEPSPPPKPSPKPPPEPAAPPREPITWERIWHTLLSERTLRALLFVGVFLLFISAVTMVAFNWRRFAPWLQITFLTGFTLFFYGLGWYVRVKMKLRESGIALSATGSLLIPVDFYAVYLTTSIFPREAWAEVWLLASVVCLGAYTITAALLRVEFFGYLVGAASVSALCAALQTLNVPDYWWWSALSGLALMMMLPARRWEREPDASLSHTFGRPFRHLALLTVTGVLLIASVLFITTGLLTPPSPGDRWALALDWWLACGVYAIAAARRPHRSLTSAACFTAPVALGLTLAPWFEAASIGRAWHALGWALLTPLYLILAHALQHRSQNEVRQRQGRTVAGWGAALILLAAAWAFGDMSAAAASHLALTGSLTLAVVLWKRPGLAPVASLFSFSTMTTWMTTLGLDLAQYCVGWALLAILHVAIAVRLRHAARYTPWLHTASIIAAGLALLPPLVALDRAAMAYALFNWTALAGWMAWLAHQHQNTEKYPGLHRLLRLAGPLRRSILHWATATPLPILFWLVWIGRRPADGWLGLGFAALAWASLGLGRWLARRDESYGLPWYVVSFLCSVTAPAVAGGYHEQPLLASALLSGAALYFTYGALSRIRWWLPVGAFTLPFGYILMLDHAGLPPDPLAASLTLVPAVYVLVSIWLERRRKVESDFLEPLYGAAHVVAIAAFFWGFGGLWNRVAWNIPWGDEARLWAAGGQLVLGITYGLAAWFLTEEGWAHVAAWLGVIAGGLIATVYSQGRGSSAAKAALLAMIYVIAERALHLLRKRHPLPHKAWPIYRRPLLVAGWTVSAGVIPLALVRNLILLGGGPVREDWAIIGLLMIVALYAASAGLFHLRTASGRPFFLWLAAALLVAPWTLLTHRGWYVWATPSAPRYALAWVVLAWVLMIIGFVLDGLAGKRYGRPLRTTAHVLLPFALVWGMGDAAISSATFGLGVAFYITVAVADHAWGRRGLSAARWLYPAALLLPVWAIYLLAWQGPWLPHAHFGLLLLTLSLPLFGIARLLRRVDPADALPAYLASYGCAIVGTMLVSYEQPLLALALLYDAALALLSARLLRHPLWAYPTAALPPAALLLSLAEYGFDVHRRGWWLIGLGAVYLAQAWALRRAAARRYATPPMATAYAVVTLGLAISSYDQVAAFWAYGAAALIYAVSAVWLQEPLFLTPAAALSAVPYGIFLDRADWIAPANYGLALWPGILVALIMAHLLDYLTGAPDNFPWERPGRWFPEAAHRLTDWWGLSFYAGGYLGALVSAGLSAEHPGRLTATLALAALVYGLATVRFQLRGWLLIAVAAAQAAALAGIWAIADGILPLPQNWVERLGYPAWRAFAFLPIALATLAAGLWVERERGEGSPFAGLRALWEGWSRPLYWLVALDVLAVQIVSGGRAAPATLVSTTHALLLMALTVIWAQPVLPYLGAALGLLAVIQRLTWVEAPNTDGPWALALLALGYGLVGYGLEYARRENKTGPLRVLERPLEQAGLFISAIAGLLMLAAGKNIWKWVFRSLFLGRPALTPADAAVVQMAVAVLALVGLLYLAAALVRRWYWRGYGAVALLLCAWSLEWFLVWDLREIQWYAIPAGLYLLSIGYLEWRQDRKTMALWIDRAALLLLLGSAFYQSLAKTYGWPYALLMGSESLFILWWGSARRQRRFLYFGVGGVVTDVGGQLIEPLLSVNAWLVFGGVGLFILVVAILVERSLEAIMQMSQELRERLEEWE